jgi:hypothetical protein
MKTLERNVSEDSVVSPIWASAVRPASRPSYLFLVTEHELGELRIALAKGNLPLDLEAKLTKLAGGNLGHHFLQQNCQTFIALLLAAQDGSFKGASRAECERLLRVLAYIRKDDDAMPDYRRDGFADDQAEVRAVTSEFGPLLQGFKAWRLCHQVPAMWVASSRP